MKHEYEIVKYRPDHRNDVAELQKGLWSPDSELNGSYLEWKYERNPYLNPPLIHLALYGGEVVGMRGMFGVNWEVGVPRNTVAGIYPDDLVIAPDHRNRGLITKIMEVALKDLGMKGYRYVYSLSAGSITRISSLAMGWRSVGSMQPQHWHSSRAAWFQRMRRSFQQTRFVWRFADRLPYRHWGERQQPLQEFCNPEGMEPRKIGHRIVVEQRVRAVDMARLVSMIDYDGRIRHVRDADYLSWRYRNPLHRYLFLYREGDGLEGYLVLQQYLSELSNRLRVNIVDWEGTTARVRSELLHGAIRLGPFADLNIWTATLGDEAKALLRKSGFRPVPEGQEGAGVGQDQPCLLVRSVRDDVPEVDWFLDTHRLLDMANWDIRMVYSMQG